MVWDPGGCGAFHVGHDGEEFQGGNEMAGGIVELTVNGDNFGLKE